MIFEKTRERLQDALSNVNVNRITDNIIKDKPKELGQIMAYNRALDIINQVEAEYTNVFKQEYDKGYSDAEKHYMDVIDSQQKLIDETKANNGWISVDDRLPEKFDSVLVSCEGSIVGGTHEGEKCEFVATGYMFSKDHWQIQGHNDVKYIKVIAWQTLPEPYTPKGE